MEEKILEMSAKQFRSYLAEAVKKEIAKRILKENDDVGSESPEEKKDGYVDKSGAVDMAKAKQEVIKMLVNRTGRGGVHRPDISEKFLQFVAQHAEKYNLKNLKDVKTIEDLAEKITFAYGNTLSDNRWEKAVKYADDLVTKYVINRGEAMVQTHKDIQAKMDSKPFVDGPEEFMDYINTYLNKYSRKYGQPRELVFDKFVAYLKKQYPDVLQANDDRVTTIVTYTDYMGGDKAPYNRSVRSDVRAFLDIFQINKGVDNVIKTSEEEPSEGEQGKENAKVTEVDGSKLREIGAMLGVTEKAINDFLAAYPAGKVKAIYDVLHNAVMKGKSAEAKRTLETYDAITQRAITMATKEFILLIDDAIDNTGDPNGNLTATDLALQIEEAGLYEDVTPEEVQNEMVGLNRIVEIINDPQYADNDFWKNFVAEILRMDLTSKVKVKSGEGKISSPNAFKSFQNLVAKAVGMIDVASFKKGGAGRPGAAIKAKMDQAQAATDEIGYQGKIKIGDMEAKEKAAKAAKAPKAPKAV